MAWLAWQQGTFGTPVLPQADLEAFSSGFFGRNASQSLDFQSGQADRQAQQAIAQGFN